MHPIMEIPRLLPLDGQLNIVEGAIQSTLEAKRHSTTSRGVLVDPSQVALDVLIYIATDH
jgi:anti-anti-sigma regulatory factor